MAFTANPIEVLALILIVISFIKIIIIIINPNAWLDNVVKKVYKPSKLTPFIFLVLALIVLYFLLQELTIIQILSVMLFSALIFAIGFSTFSKELIQVADKLYKEGKIVKRSWLSLAIWIILLLWGLKEIFL